VSCDKSHKFPAFFKIGRNGQIARTIVAGSWGTAEEILDQTFI